MIQNLQKTTKKPCYLDGYIGCSIIELMLEATDFVGSAK